MDPRRNLLAFVILLINIFLYGQSFASTHLDVAPIALSSGLDSDSNGFFSILKDELQNLRLELTKSFIEEHTRIRRETSSGAFNYKVKLDLEHVSEIFTTKVDNVGHSTTIFNDSTYVFQRDGIYRLEKASASDSLKLVKVIGWELQSGNKVLHSFEWESKLFILVSDKNGSFCQLFILQSTDLSDSTLISRQNFKNEGYVTSAQFFNHGNVLCLVVTVDNSAHLTAPSRIYRWVHTYMDIIHEIHTKGASAVETFTIGSFKYIVFAQSQDDNGNTEVGTLVIRMFGGGEIERLQLVWSNEPVAVKYLPFLKEDFLIIGQRKETVAYWFAGVDFSYWDSLKGLSGNQIFLDGFVWQGEPILMAANENNVYFYTRITSSQLASSKLTKTSSVFTANSPKEILAARILQISKTTFSLALTTQSSRMGAIKLEIIPLKITREEIPESQIKETKDQLSQCMITLGGLLARDEPGLVLFETTGDKILTKDKPWTYSGKISSLSHVFVGDGSNLGTVVVKPDGHSGLHTDAVENSPSQTLAQIERYAHDLKHVIQTKLPRVLRKSKEGEITGHLTFKNKLAIENLNSKSNLNLLTLNGIPWSSLLNNVLFHKSPRTQVITGEWNVEQFHADSVKTLKEIEHDFLLTKCLNDETQIIRTNYVFQKDLKFIEDVSFEDHATINGISLSNIALRNRNAVISGYKHADFVFAKENVDIQKLNHLKISEWYHSVLKTDDSEDQHAEGLLTFANDLSINNLQVDELNRKSWDEFMHSILLDVGNQTVHGDLISGNLKVDHLRTETVNGKDISNLLSTTSDQHISSEIHTTNLRLRKNLNTPDLGSANDFEPATINGILLRNAVVNSKDAIIDGPLELQKMTLGNILTPDGITINGLDISEVAKLRKKYTYFTANPEEDIHLDGDVQATKFYSGSLNGIHLDSMHSSFWSSQTANEIEHDFDLTKASSINVESEYNTGTLNGLNTATDFITTTKHDEIIESRIRFTDSVVVEGDVIVPDGITLNDIDISKFERQIVRTDDDRIIHGQKWFQDGVDVDAGIMVKKVNDISLEDDVVYLSTRAGHQQQIFDLKHFEELGASKLLSDSDVEVGGAVNGLNLKEIGKTTAYNDEPLNIQSDVVFTQPIEVQDLHVGDINGLKFDEIVAQSISLSEPQHSNFSFVVDNGSLIFEEDCHLPQINSIETEELLPQIINRHHSLNIGGFKQFRGPLKVLNDLKCETINGINLVNLEETGLSRSKDQVVTGKFVVKDAVIENLQTTKIGGILVSDFVQTHKDTIVTSPVEFTKDLNVHGDLIVTGLFNGYDVGKLSEDLKILKGVRHFNEITVDGNLSWKHSHPEFQRLSHVFEHAVTIHTPQTFTDTITFENGFHANSIESEHWINNIDLDAIKKDAVELNEQNLELTGNNVFSKPIHVAHGSVEVTKLDTDEVNGLVLKELDENLVRKNKNLLVTGTKTFASGFFAESLRVLGTIDGINPKDLVTVNDTREINHLTFKDVHVGNLDFTTMSDINLRDLLLELVSLKGSNSISGDITFEKDVIVHECYVKSINGIELSDVLLSNSQTPQHVTGHKTFDKLTIHSKLENVRINNYDFDKISSNILRRHHDEIIERPIIFTDTVEISKAVNVAALINDKDFETESTAFAAKITQFVNTTNVDSNTLKTAQSLISTLETNLKSIPGWFKFLEFKQNLDELDPRTRVEHSITDDGLTLFLHKRELDGTKCGLPSGCSSRSIQFLNVDEQSLLARSIGSAYCDGVFEVTSPSGSLYLVYSQIASTNTTCTRVETGTTNVYFLTTRISKDRFNFKNTETGHPLATFSVTRIDTGYIKDVATFHSNGNDFILIAQYYDHKTGSHDTNTLVYKVVQPGELQLIQSIKTHGAIRLSMDSVDNKSILGIVNTKSSSSSSSCHVHCAVYYWDDAKHEFNLIRIVETENPSDIVSITAWNGDTSGDNFIAFAERRDTDVEREALGKISIYRFEKEHLSYSQYQIIDTTHPVTSLSALKSKEYNYLVLTCIDGLQFYKYRHAEGFRRELSVPITGARDTNGIIWNNIILFPTVGDQSILAKGVFGGTITPASSTMSSN